MFQKATKSQARLRAAIFGPSGAGKTYSCLRIATGIGGPIALIDTERGSASKYADRFEFDTADLTDKTINGYVRAINEAGKAGYNVLIIDSLSHAWAELLTQIDQIAKAKYRGNTWSAWSEGTPQQRKLVDAILDYPGHVITTMRSKTEWQTQEAGGGKSKPVRVGLSPEQGKGIEYEFDILLEMSVDHTCQVIKDRSGGFQDRLIDRPGEEFGAELAAWLSTGSPAPTAAPTRAAAPAPAAPAPAPAQLSSTFAAGQRAITAAATVEKLKAIGDRLTERHAAGELTDDERDQLLAMLLQREQELAPDPFGDE